MFRPEILNLTAGRSRDSGSQWLPLPIDPKAFLGDAGLRYVIRLRAPGGPRLKTTRLQLRKDGTLLAVARDHIHHS